MDVYDQLSWLIEDDPAAIAEDVVGGLEGIYDDIGNDNPIVKRIEAMLQVIADRFGGDGEATRRSENPPWERNERVND